MSAIDTAARTALGKYFADDPFRKQVDFAGEIGISPGHLGDLIRGRRRPSFEIAKKIEHLTGGLIRLDDWVCLKEAAPAKRKRRAA